MSREILSPPLQRMGPNRCYRVNVIHEDFVDRQQARNHQPTQNQYVEPDMYAEDDDEDETNCLIEELSDSSFKLTMHVAPSFYGGLIGFKGSTKRRVEEETKTDINIPRNREAGGSSKSENIIIKGKTQGSVCSARRKLNSLIESLRKRMRPTHFVGVSLNSGEVRENFIKFRQEVLDANIAGVDEQLFQADNRIHLTLVTCVLLDDVERTKAVELLQSCSKYLAELKTPLEIKVSGLEIMNDDPSAVRVIYACVEAPELQEFANYVSKLFLESGYSFDEYNRDNIKLHMTVMNNRYRKQNNALAAQHFDAREILKTHSKYRFGNINCNEAHLCVLGSGQGNDPYKITGTLKF